MDRMHAIKSQFWSCGQLNFVGYLSLVPHMEHLLLNKPSDFRHFRF